MHATSENLFLLISFYIDIIFLRFECWLTYSLNSLNIHPNQSENILKKGGVI